ncbi:MAG: competence/damage-inducible protein A [Cyanobacteria bacterium]|nr:competence/damage-inducible protein A [Cyanobacteriota bacterium]
MNRSAEIICIGTELLLGDILNTNVQFLAQELARLGIAHYYQTVVGDNPQRIHQVMDIACARSQLLLFTGGLGPTPDDLTIETLADYFGVPLGERPEILADIRQKFEQRGRTMSPSNRKQALLPEGAAILPNPTGSAPGIIWQPRPEVTLMTFPGVPREMQVMWQETAVPYLQTQGWTGSIIYSRTLKFWGIGESTLAEKVAPLLAQENPTVAPYANNGGVKLRISTRAATPEAAIACIDPVAEQIQAIAGLDYYGDDDDTLATVVGRLLLERHQTVAVAESCTGGGLGQLLTTAAGSSTYFLGGVVSYSNEVKQNLLGVEADTLEAMGAVSAEVAEEMAMGVRLRLATDWGLSITGIAGPSGGSEAKPVGLVYIGLADPHDKVTHYQYQFGSLGGRDWVRHLSGAAALDQLRRHLMAPEHPSISK